MFLIVLPCKGTKNSQLFALFSWKIQIIFVTLEEFAESLLYKGVAEDWEILGLRFRDRSQFIVLPPKGRSVALQSAINCLKEHPTQSHRLFRGSSSGAKVHIYFQFSKYSLGEILFCVELKFGIWLRLFLFFQFVCAISIPATWNKYSLIHQLIKKYLYSSGAGT